MGFGNTRHYEGMDKLSRCLFVGQEEWGGSRTAIANDPIRRVDLETPEGLITLSVVVLTEDKTIKKCGEVEIDSSFTDEHINVE